MHRLLVIKFDLITEENIADIQQACKIHHEVVITLREESVPCSNRVSINTAQRTLGNEKKERR